MPEEINRIVTDSIADLLWTPSPDADANLAREGIDPSKIERVGNIMIDAFEMLRTDIAKAEWPNKKVFTERDLRCRHLASTGERGRSLATRSPCRSVRANCCYDADRAPVAPTHPAAAGNREVAYAPEQHSSLEPFATAWLCRIHERSYVGAICAY